MIEKYKIQRNEKTKAFELYETASEQVLAVSYDQKNITPLYRALKKGYGFGSGGWTPRFFLTQVPKKK